MALTYELIKKLAQAYPNDMKLGAAIRREVQTIEESRKIIKDPNQIDLEDMINEINQQE